MFALRSIIVCAKKTERERARPEISQHVYSSHITTRSTKCTLRPYKMYTVYKSFYMGLGPSVLQHDVRYVGLITATIRYYAELETVVNCYPH